MHCCDIARAGQPLPVQLPNEWLHTQHKRTDSTSKSNDDQIYAKLNQQLKDTFNLKNKMDHTTVKSSSVTPETERKYTYEEKRLKNYEVCLKRFLLFVFSILLI